MQNENILTRHLNGRFTFFQQFLRHPLEIGSVIPSSRFLERRIVEAAHVADAGVVVELGPGTGGTTRALLDAMPKEARLLTIEVNPRFHAMVSAIDDPRLIPHQGSAADLESILAAHGLAAPDAVVSGIPFSTMPPELGSRVLESVSNALAPDGRFVAYQWSGRVCELCQPFLGQGSIAMELRNIPPMRVFRWHNNRP